MLSTILQSKQTQFTALAEVWLATGAKTFSIWEDDHHLLAQWPVEGQPGKELVTVPIRVEETVVGALQVTGLNGAQTHHRLTAEAAWIAQLIKLEQKLAGLETESPEWQSQLLKIITMVESAGDPREIGQLFNEFVREVQKTIQAEAVFIALDTVEQPMIIEQYPPAMLDEATFNYFFERMEADRDYEIVLDRKNAASIVPPEMSSIYLRAIPVHHQTLMIVGVLLKQPVSLSAPDLRLAHAIAEDIEGHLKRLPVP
ncbi:MAG: hypothetical protein KDF65_11505 [Anaerolineae bacterium]|nr:hypothetical protein [Anaerolineae bacterium]